MKGFKLDAGKLRWSLLPFIALIEVLKVLEFGAKKYSVDNWKRVENTRQRYFDAAMRHMTSWWEGEKNDPETKLNHLAHAMCCLLFLLWFDLKGKK